MSLRLRLTLVVVILFLLALFLITARSVAGARQDMREEMEFSRQIVFQFIDLMPVVSDEAEQDVAITRLRSQLSRLETVDRFSISFSNSADNRTTRAARACALRRGFPACWGWTAAASNWSMRCLAETYFKSTSTRLAESTTSGTNCPIP